MDNVAADKKKFAEIMYGLAENFGYELSTVGFFHGYFAFLFQIGAANRNSCIVLVWAGYNLRGF